MNVSRQKVRKALISAGVPVGRITEGDNASIVEFVEFWGVWAGVPGTGADTPDIERALTASGIEFSADRGNGILVRKVV